MTAVDEQVRLGRAGSIFLPVSAPRAPRSVPPTVVTPRVSPTLVRRQQWERRYRMRLRFSDVTIMVGVTALTALLQILVARAATEVTVRNGIVLVVVWTLVLAMMDTRSAAIFGSGATEYRRVTNASGFAFGLLAIIAILLGWDGVRLLLVLTLPVGLLTLLASRWIWRHWLQQQRLQGRFASRTLVVGDAEDVDYVISSLKSGGETGYHVIAATLFDRAPDDLASRTHSHPVIGNVNTVAVSAAEIGADTIIVASRPEGEADFVKNLSWQLEGTASELVLSSRLTDVAGPRISLRQVDGLPLIKVRIPTYEGGRHIAKRALDIIVSTIALIPVGLITPFLALAIVIDSRGPVFFRQERVGRDGRTFRIIKFRSMRTDAERQLAALRARNEGAGLLFKMKDDPRVTRVGRILRRYSLDELPQFWNVFIGNMSIVGPRPPLPREVTDYDGTVYRRLYIKPGITGLWQISGRSNLSWDESVRLDLRYVENWSVMSDLQIMWQTVKVMVEPNGAY